MNKASLSRLASSSLSPEPSTGFTCFRSRPIHLVRLISGAADGLGTPLLLRVSREDCSSVSLRSSKASFRSRAELNSSCSIQEDSVTFSASSSVCWKRSCNKQSCSSILPLEDCILLRDAIISSGALTASADSSSSEFRVRSIVSAVSCVWDESVFFQSGRSLFWELPPRDLESRCPIMVDEVGNTGGKMAICVGLKVWLSTPVIRYRSSRLTDDGTTKNRQGKQPPLQQWRFTVRYNDWQG